MENDLKLKAIKEYDLFTREQLLEEIRKAWYAAKYQKICEYKDVDEYLLQQNLIEKKDEK